VCKVELTEHPRRYLLFRTLFDSGEVAFPDDSSDLILDSQLCRFIVEVAVCCSYRSTENHRALVMVTLCYGALEIVGLLLLLRPIQRHYLLGLRGFTESAFFMFDALFGIKIKKILAQ